MSTLIVEVLRQLPVGLMVATLSSRCHVTVRRAIPGVLAVLRVRLEGPLTPSKPRKLYSCVDCL